jgi:hypothetical protein
MFCRTKLQPIIVRSTLRRGKEQTSFRVGGLPRAIHDSGEGPDAPPLRLTLNLTLPSAIKWNLDHFGVDPKG